MHSSTSVTSKTGSLLPLSADNTASPIRTQEQGGSQPATFANLLQRHTSEPVRSPTDEVTAAREQQRQPERTADTAERERDQTGPRMRDTRTANAQRPAARQAEKSDKPKAGEKTEAKDEKAEDEAGATDPAAAAGANGWFAALAASRPAPAGGQPPVGADAGKDGAKAAADKAVAVVTEATAQPDAGMAAALPTGQPQGPKAAPGGVEPGAAKTLAVDERSGQSARQAATGADAVNMLGAAADAAQDGGQAAGGAHGFESALMAAQAAHQAGAAHGTRTAEAATAHVETPVGSPGFADALGEQVRMLVTQAAGRGESITHEAKLSLNPAELGPITIRIALEGQQAQVEFTAASEVTRRAIEDSLPQLAGALQGEGLTLAGGGVYEQRQQPGEAGQNGQQGQAASGRGSVVGINAPAGLNDSSTAAPTPRRGQGAVDLYA
ncbi:MAG: flagellar hook-length control protein FliK [Aquabacterium sp.]|nr:MAG: flagellar hook-length control protein FliK [Aquabacterium sp.]